MKTPYRLHPAVTIGLAGSATDLHYSVRDARSGLFYNFTLDQGYLLLCLRQFKTAEEIAREVDEKFNAIVELEDAEKFMTRLREAGLLVDDTEFQPVQNEECYPERRPAYTVVRAPEEPKLIIRPQTRQQCIACGFCCTNQASYRLAPIAEEEVARIMTFLAETPFRLASKDTLFNVFPPNHPLQRWGYALNFLMGGCPFLSEGRFCGVHHYRDDDGPIKPFVCRWFPLHVVARPSGLAAGTSFRCLGNIFGIGPPLQSQTEWIRQMIQEELAVQALPKELPLTPDQHIGVDQYEELRDALLADLARGAEMLANMRESTDSAATDAHHLLTEALRKLGLFINDYGREVQTPLLKAASESMQALQGDVADIASSVTAPWARHMAEMLPSCVDRTPRQMLDRWLSELLFTDHMVDFGDVCTGLTCALCCGYLALEHARRTAEHLGNPLLATAHGVYIYNGIFHHTVVRGFIDVSKSFRRLALSSGGIRHLVQAIDQLATTLDQSEPTNPK